MQQGSKEYYKTRYRAEVARDWIWQKINQRFLGADRGQSLDAAVDLGSGYGSWIRSMPAKKRWAVDLNEDLTELFRERGIKGVETVVASCTDLAFLPDASIDVVTASNLIEHLEWPDVHACLREVHRVLKPGGSFWILQPNFSLCYKNYFDDFTHRTIHTPRSLVDLLESEGFKVKKIWPRFLPFSMKSRLSLFSFLVPLYLRSPWKPWAGQMAAIFRKV